MDFPIKFALFLVHSLTVFFLLNLSAEASKHPSVPATFICYGDSITYASDIPKGQRWCDLLQEKSKGSMVFLNEGKDGRQTSHWADFEDVLKRRETVNVFLISLGTNDLKMANEGKISEIMDNIDKMVKDTKAKYPGVKVVLMGTYNISIKNLISYWRVQRFGHQTQDLLRKLGLKMEDYARTHKDVFTFNVHGLLPDENLPDGVHPDTGGHRLIADFLWDQLIESNLVPK